MDLGRLCQSKMLRIKNGGSKSMAAVRSIEKSQKRDKWAVDLRKSSSGMRRPRDAVYYLTGPGSFTPWPRDAMYYTQATRKAFGFEDSYPGAARTSQLLGPLIRKFRKGGKTSKISIKPHRRIPGVFWAPWAEKSRSIF